MYSKLSVVSKFGKIQHFNPNRLKYLWECEYGNIRNLYTKHHRTALVIPQQINVIPSTAKNVKQFKLACHMSSNDKDGNGKNIKNIDNKKKLFKLRKKKLLRTTKLNNLKKSSGDRKVSQKSGNYNDAKLKKSKTSTDQLHSSKSTNEILKVHVSKSAKPQSITQSPLPDRKAVHIEFMESQNLKDFNLNRIRPTRLSFQNVTKSVIDTPVKQKTSHYEQTFSNKKESKQLIILKNPESKEVRRDLQIKPTTEIKKKDFVREPAGERNVNINHKTSHLPEKISLSKPLSSDGPIKSIKPQILYLDRPKEEKAKILKDSQPDDLLRIKPKETQEEKSAKKFWRIFSVTVLPLTLAFTGYALSNLGFAEVVRTVNKWRFPFAISQNLNEPEHSDSNKIDSKADTDGRTDGESAKK